jgi:hypothetical protein
MAFRSRRSRPLAPLTAGRRFPHAGVLQVDRTARIVCHIVLAGASTRPKRPAQLASVKAPSRMS